jgi:hypothetical protein
MTDWQMVGHRLALVAVSLVPVVVGGAGPVYLASALLLGIGFLTCAVTLACGVHWRGPARYCGRRWSTCRRCSHCCCWTAFRTDRTCPSHGASGEGKE